MSSNTAFNAKSPNNNICQNRAPGSERRYSVPNNLFMSPSNIVPSISRSRNNSGEVHRTPWADRRSRSPNNSTRSTSERSTPDSNVTFPMYYEYPHVFADLAPGSNRPSSNAFFGQHSSNFGGSSIRPCQQLNSSNNMFSIKINKPVIQNSNESNACNSYDNGVFVSSQCQDYNNSFYDRCVDHQRLRITCDHRIIKFSKDVRNVPDSLCIGSTQTRLMGSHHSAIEDYESYEQLATQMMSAINIEEKKTTEKLMLELDQARSFICSKIESHYTMESNVRRITLNVQKDIKHSFQSNIERLERRQTELLYYLQDQKVKQLKALDSKIQNYNEYNLKITQLNDALMSIQNSNNLDEIKKINSSVSKEIRSLNYKMNSGTPINPLVIFFQEIDIRTQHNIASLGGLLSEIVELSKARAVQDLCKKGRAILGIPYMIKVLQPSRPFCFGKDVLCRPWGVCCDQHGNIYVGDRSNHRITIFKSNGAFIGEIGKHGTGPVQFNRPAGIAIDLLGRLIIADKDNHRVQIVGRDGKLITEIGGISSGSEDGQFNYPWDVAVNMKGDIVVTDSRNKRIQLFDLYGKFIGKFCFDNVFPVRKPKTEPTPRSVCFTPTGDILVADFHHLCVVAISHDLKKYQLLQFEKQFSRPQGIACDDFGNIIIADSRDNQIKVFRQTGQLVFTIGQAGNGIGELDRPNGICLTPEGRIVCVDFGNNRLEVF